MKFTRIILSLVILLPITLSAQVTNTSTRGNRSVKQVVSIEKVIEDTIKTTLVLIDTTELQRFRKLVIYNDKDEKKFSVKVEDLGTDPRFSQYQDKYILNNGEWGNAASVTIKGIKHDDTELLLTGMKKKERVEHVIVHKEKPQSLKRIKSAPVPEEELNN